MSRFWRISGYCAALVMGGYFLWFLLCNLHPETLAALASPTVGLAVFVAALIYVTIIPVTAWAWVQLLSCAGEIWSVGWLARLIGLTQVAKYIPGNIAQHATRAALSLRSGMKASALAATVVQETVLTVSASVAVGLLALTGSARGLAQLPEAARGALAVLAGGVIALVLVVAAIQRPISQLDKHRSPWVRALGVIATLPKPVATATALLAYSLNFLSVGFALWLVARVLGLPAQVDFALITASFALSWTLGFLAPGAPAGVGVREGIMLLLLRDAAAADQLLLFVLLCRVVSMLGDGLCFAGASLLRIPEEKRRYR